MPTVINRWHFRHVPGVGPWRAIDPSRPPLPEPWIYIGRGTALGNPHRLVRGTAPEIVLGKFRGDLWQWIETRRPAVLAAFRRITDAHHLVCSCKPGPCHGDIVVNAWRWLQTPAGAALLRGHKGPRALGGRT